MRLRTPIDVTHLRTPPPHPLVTPTSVLQGEEVSETVVDVGVGLQQWQNHLEHLYREQFRHLTNILQTLPQEALPLRLILNGAQQHPSWWINNFQPYVHAQYKLNEDTNVYHNTTDSVTPVS